MNTNSYKKRILCLSMALGMTVSTNVLADVSIPPTAGGGSQQTVQTGSATPSRFPAISGEVVTQAAAGTGTTQTQTAVNADGTLAKPQIQSQGAVLYDATHNQFLFEQNSDMQLFPASITKLMTALLTVEHTNLNDMVTFSNAAVTNLESGAVTLKIQAGDQLSVKDSLYGLLMKSANEIANGLAEKVAGSVSGFADLMNQKAASLGCTHTNFVNPNGLNNPQHLTTARDMALIANAFFANQTIREIEAALNYDFPATKAVSSVRKLTMSHKMLNPANAEYYPGVIGGKTGYTSLAGNTLVTCAERDGVRLIAVVLKSKQAHYQDTKALFDYGFAAVKTQNPSQNASSSASGPASGPAGELMTQTQNGNRWVQDQNGWKFVKANGAYAKNESMIINQELYHFAENEYMVNGWNELDGIWYFFRPSGGLAKSRWIETNGLWYYVDANGSLFTGGTTPDGFTVNADGIWVQ